MRSPILNRLQLQYASRYAISVVDKGERLSKELEDCLADPSQNPRLLWLEFFEFMQKQWKEFMTECSEPFPKNQQGGDYLKFLEKKVLYGFMTVSKFLDTLGYLIGDIKNNAKATGRLDSELLDLSDSIGFWFMTSFYSDFSLILQPFYDDFFKNKKQHQPQIIELLKFAIADLIESCIGIAGLMRDMRRINSPLVTISAALVTCFNKLYGQISGKNYNDKVDYTQTLLILGKSICEIPSAYAGLWQTEVLKQTDNWRWPVVFSRLFTELKKTIDSIRIAEDGKLRERVISILSFFDSLFEADKSPDSLAARTWVRDQLANGRKEAADTADKIAKELADQEEIEKILRKTERKLRQLRKVECARLEQEKPESEPAAEAPSAIEPLPVYKMTEAEDFLSSLKDHGLAEKTAEIQRYLDEKKSDLESDPAKKELIFLYFTLTECLIASAREKLISNSVVFFNLKELRRISEGLAKNSENATWLRAACRMSENFVEELKPESKKEPKPGISEAPKAKVLKVKFPPDVEKIMRAFERLKKKYYCEIFLVGGLVRDILRGHVKENPDVDLSILYLPGFSKNLDSQKELKRLLADEFEVDESAISFIFGKGVNGYCKLVVGEKDYDLRFSSSKTQALDARERDATDSALAASCSGTVIETIPGSIDDYQRKIYRAINLATFFDDPNRLLRPLYAQYVRDCTLDPELAEKLDQHLSALRGKTKEALLEFLGAKKDHFAAYFVKLVFSVLQEKDRKDLVDALGFVPFCFLSQRQTEFLSRRSCAYAIAISDAKKAYGPSLEELGVELAEGPSIFQAASAAKVVAPSSALQPRP